MNGNTSKKKAYGGKKIPFVQTTSDEKEIALSPGHSFLNRLRIYKGLHFAPRKCSVAGFPVNCRRLKKGIVMKEKEKKWEGRWLKLEGKLRNKKGQVDRSLNNYLYPGKSNKKRKKSLLETKRKWDVVPGILRGIFKKRGNVCNKGSSIFFSENVGILFNEAERTWMWVKDDKWSQVLFGYLVWPRGLPNIKAFSSADQKALH